MKIEVAIKKGESSKDKGDLFENVCEKILEAQNYEVIKELRNTGVEIDLLCKNKVNINKEIYIECKAFRNEKINSDVILKLIGIQKVKGYKEAWLIPTTEYGKEAKGLIHEEEKKGENQFSFFTPEKIINAMISCKEIESSEISKKNVVELIGKTNIGSCILLITKFGIFWVFEYKLGGKPTGVILTYASDSQIVKDKSLLEEISNTDTSLSELDFLKVFLSDKSSTDKNGRFILENEYLKKILDTNVKFTHPKKENLNIEDIFVYQDIQDIQDINSEHRISSASLAKIKKGGEKVLIFGDDASGKTTLAYKIQREYIEKNKLPIYIKAESIRSSDIRRLKGLIRKNIKKQYRNVSEPEISKIEGERIILIIDDYQALELNRESTLILNRVLSDNYSNIYIFSNTSKKLKLTLDSEMRKSLIGFDFYRINEYGHKLRDDLISKWLSIGQEETINDENKHNKIIEIANTINIIVGNKFVPTYPIFVLTLLQSFEVTTANSLTGSAYAEFYNYLITHALGKSGVETSKFGLYYSYLSELAFLFFKEAENEIDKDDLRSFHENFFTRKKLNYEFQSFYSILINSKIIKFENDRYRFSHNYTYYFFVARYLSEKLTTKPIQDIINSIIKKLYISDFANIFLFLIHFSKDPFIFDRIIKESKEVFSESSPVTLDEKEFLSLNSLIKEEVKFIIDNEPAEKIRANELVLRDELSGEKSANCSERKTYKYNDDVKQIDFFGKLNLSFKLIELLGQLAKNYSELDGDVKMEVITEAYNLGLRSLMKIMSDFEQYSDVLIEDMKSVIRSKSATLESDIENIATKIIFSFASMITYGFFSKISNSVASKDLVEITNDVYNVDKTIAKEIINIAIELDFVGGLNVNKILKLSDGLNRNKNNIGAMTLRLLVIGHLYKFNIDFKKRQQLCNKLNIDVNNHLLLSNRSKQIV